MELSQAVADFLDYLEIEKGRSLKTIENYSHYLNRFADYAGDIDVSAIDQDLISKWRQNLNRTELADGRSVSRTTQNYHLIALRSFLKFLAKRNIDSYPADKIELATAKRPQVSFLTREEVVRLIDSIDTSTIIGLRDRAIIEMLFSSGLRVSELVKLNRRDIDLKRGEFSIRGKGQKDRPVFLSDAAIVSINDYLAKRTDNYQPLFIHYSGTKIELNEGDFTRLTPRSVQRLVEKHARAAGITKHVTPHTLRHSFATDLLTNGADLRSVQSMLGHTHIATTQVYTHITDPQLKKVHQRFHSDNQKTESEDRA